MTSGMHMGPAARDGAPLSGRAQLSPDSSVVRDERARERIRNDLATNLLVEAGAGSGKTFELVSRMLALVRSGVPVSRIAAVTFTRKAAGELAQKFREELEKARRTALASGDASAGLLERALAEIDRGFIGTIHAFCARLLRERPLAAGVDPEFVEVSGAEEERLRADFWTRYLDDLHARGDPILSRLHGVGIDPAELGPRFRRRGEDLRPGEHGRAPEAFRDMVADPDVVFPVEQVAVPDFAGVREELKELLDRARRLIPRAPLSHRGWDPLQSTLRRLLFLRTNSDWKRPADFFAGLEEVTASACKVTLSRWTADPRVAEQVRALRRELERFATGPGAARAREAWYAHRYAVILDLLLPAVRDFTSYRRATGQLTFQDLLALAAELLRGEPEARRDLGERYRHLLVDEFQDTDPLQAEVCLLLASPPEEGTDWLAVRPREGSLFVVGDPKQSIYRFRRADIEVYSLVKERFEALGAVLELTRNFRSRPAIGRFVDAVFQRFFPPEATAEQAAFAPLNTQQVDGPGRVFRYEIAAPGKKRDILGPLDARMVASWIATRIASGERKAGDFLVLPYPKAALEFYARELERRDIPVTTTGAGLTVELELRELRVLLEALADPGDHIWTLAALEGLFFGLDPEQLLRYRRETGRLSFEGREFDLSSPVGRALSTMRRWADLCRDEPMDAALAQIVDEIGLLPLAAGGEMAESRAGSLVHALDVVASAAMRGASDLRSALEAIEGAMESADVEAPLRPGRTGAVRLMNLHKAKGLEAPVVILPYPAGHVDHDPARHIRRGEGGPPLGWLNFRKDYGQGTRTLARPADWEAHAERERRFARAEHARLLYVAATRAREELVVGECTRTLNRSPWRELHEELVQLATPLEIAVTDPAPRRRPTATVAEIADRAARLEAARHHAAEPAYAVASVTDLSEEEFAFCGTEGRGREWGAIVHRAIATMGRGRSGDALRRYCRAVLLAEGRPTDASGEPIELEELLELLRGLCASPVWSELARAPSSRWELRVARLERVVGGTPVLLGGVVDAMSIACEGEPWRIVDWKTDVVVGEEWSARARQYAGQVEAYRRIVTALAGRDVEGTIQRLGGTRSEGGDTPGPGSRDTR